MAEQRHWDNLPKPALKHVFHLLVLQSPIYGIPQAFSPALVCKSWNFSWQTEMFSTKWVDFYRKRSSVSVDPLKFADDYRTNIRKAIVGRDDILLNLASSSSLCELKYHSRVSILPECIKEFSRLEILYWSINLSSYDRSAVLEAFHLAPLSTLKKLNHLHISTNSFAVEKIKKQDVTPLTQLTRLDLLYVRPGVMNLAAFSNLSILQVAWAKILPEDMVAISKLSSLRTLYFTNNEIRNGEVDISTVLLGKLQDIVISHCNLKNLGDLSDATALTSLYLSHNNLSEVKGLSALSNLQKLICSYNQKLNQLEDLSGATGLTYLELSVNNLHEVKGLSALSNLQRLDCTNNQKLKQLVGLSALTSLTQLLCYNCSLKHLPELVILAPKLVDLNISNNKLQEFPDLLLFTNLTSLDISRNSLSTALKDQIKACMRSRDTLPKLKYVSYC